MTCVHPPQEPPGYDLARPHYSRWCDSCHRAIWYETGSIPDEVGDAGIGAMVDVDLAADPVWAPTPDEVDEAQQ